MNELARLIRQEIDRQGMDDADVAKAVGISPSMLSDIVNGKKKNPLAPEILSGFSRVLGVPKTKMLQVLGYLDAPDSEIARYDVSTPKGRLLDLIDRYSWTPQDAMSVIWHVYFVHPQAKEDWDRSMDRAEGHITALVRLEELEPDEQEAFRSLYSQAEKEIDGDTLIPVSVYEPAMPDSGLDMQRRPSYLVIPGQDPKLISPERKRNLVDEGIQFDARNR